jgi:hypothetical protein
MRRAGVGCMGKVPYETRRQAEQVVQQIARRHAVRSRPVEGKMNVYRCRQGPHYHIGHEPIPPPRRA